MFLLPTKPLGKDLQIIKKSPQNENLNLINDELKSKLKMKMKYEINFTFILNKLFAEVLRPEVRGTRYDVLNASKCYRLN